MDKEFLMDYEAKEKEEIKKFTKKFREGKIESGDVYPQKYRLKLNKPYTTSITGDDIWTQIPLYGTTVITLQPTKNEIFKKIHGFDIEDIDRLIDLARESGRVQFALYDYPTRYMGMDFLEPLFRETMPPKLIHLPLDCIITNEEIGHHSNEIVSLLENPQTINFIEKYIKKKYTKSTMSQDTVRQGLLEDFIRLKLLGYGDLVEHFIGWLAIVDVDEYVSLLKTLHDIFLFSHDPLKGIKSFRRKEIDRLNKQFSSFNINTNKKIELPYEVGKFLNDKLRLIRIKNLDGTIELCDEYDLYDLRKVMNTLNESVEKEKTDEIIEKSKQVSLIFENVWSDAYKLKNKVNIYRNGISFGFGVMGAVATLPISGVRGLLSGLGFLVADKFLDRQSYGCFSERIVKFITQNQITHIYDFRKKYKLL
jgi:hypothetical protein